MELKIVDYFVGYIQMVEYTRGLLELDFIFFGLAHIFFLLC